MGCHEMKKRCRQMKGWRTPRL